MNLVELLADKVESLCGYKPDKSLVINFLSKIFNHDIAVTATKEKPVWRKQIKSIKAKSSEEYHSNFPCIDRDNLPVGLADVLEVILEIFINGKDYNDAVRDLCKRRKLRSIHTIYDKCTRHIGLNTEEFRELLGDKTRLSRHLKRRFPKNKQQIDKCFENII